MNVALSWEYKGPWKSGHILHILHIVHILICPSTSAWLISVNLQTSTSVMNKHKSCMWFQFPQYWDAFLLFQWGRTGQYPSPCNENRLTFPERSVINQQAVVMVVGGGMWTAEPWDKGPSNSGNKQWKTRSRYFSLWICTICTICRLLYAEYAQYACMKICRIRRIICKKYGCNMQNNMHNMQTSM